MSTMWLQHRATLTRLYQVERKTLHEVKQVMEEQYGFPETPLSTYETKLKIELNLKKKLKAQDWVAIGRYFAAHDNQAYDVYLNGVLIPEPKVRKEVSRNLKRRPTVHPAGNPPIPDYVTLKPNSRNPRPRPVGNSFNLLDNISGLTENMDLTIGSGSLFPGLHIMQNDSINIPDIHSLTNNQLILSNKTISFTRIRDPLMLTMPFDGVLLDRTFNALWSARVNKLPISQLQSFFASLSPNVSFSDDYFNIFWNASSTMSMDDHSMNMWQIEHMDAFQLGLSTEAEFQGSPTSQTFPFQSTSHYQDFQLAREVDPFNVINTVMYCLSNHCRVGDAIQQTMRWLFERVSPTLLDAFLRMDNPTVKAARKELLDWAYYLGGKDFFISFMAAVIDDLDWIKENGAYCLTAAAWLNCTQICIQLLHRRVSPNHEAEFPERIYELDSDDLLSRKDNHDTALGYLPHSINGSIPDCAMSRPLVEAAAMGHNESLMVLLQGGAKVELQCEGYTAAGYVLIAIHQALSTKQSHLDALKRLIEYGADVNAPFWENPSYEDTMCIHRDDVLLDCSEESLFDEACVMGRHELIELLAKHYSAPPSCLTISGLISNAEEGSTALQNYLDKSKFPRGLRRRRLMELSLRGSLRRPKAFSSMVYLGFDLSMLHLRSGVGSFDKPDDTPPSRLIPEEQYRLLEAMSTLPVALLSRDVIALILGKEGLVKRSFIRSCILGAAQNFEHLLSSGLEVDGEDGIVLMAEAARGNRKEVISILIRHGVDINGTFQRRDVSWSVLSLSITGKKVRNDLDLLDLDMTANIEMLDFLYDQGADVGSCREFLDTTKGLTLDWLGNHGLRTRDESIYDIMTRLGNIPSKEKLRILRDLQQTELPIFTDEVPTAEHGIFSTAEHPLSYFIMLNADLDFIEEVLDTGIDVNGRGFESSAKTPLQVAVGQGNLALVKVLTGWGANVNDKFESGTRRALHLACEPPKSHIGDGSPIDILKHLLRHGAKVNKRVEYGSYLVPSGLDKATCPLHIIIAKWPSPETKIQAVKVLVENGARVNKRGRRYGQKPGLSPLEQLCSQDTESNEIAELLLDHGAKIHPPPHYEGKTALELASWKGHLSIVKTLLTRGADPNSGHPDNPRALALAALEGNIPIILLLLDAGAKVTGVPIGSSSFPTIPLTAASCAGKLDTVVLLLDYETREEAFIDAIKQARNRGWTEIVELIQNHMDKLQQPAIEEIDED